MKNVNRLSICFNVGVLFVILMLFQACSKTDDDSSLDDSLNKQTSLETLDALDVTFFSATLRGNIDNLDNVLECGIYLWLSSDVNNKIKIISKNIDNDIEINVDDLKPRTSYRYNIYIKTKDGEYTGEPVSFTTKENPFSKIIIEHEESNKINVSSIINKNSCSKISDSGFYISSSKDALYNLSNKISSSITDNKIFCNYEVPINEVLYISAYVICSDKEFHSEITSLDAFTDIGAKVKTVDLGLPSGTKWAEFNIGAKSILDYGGYYAWGEVIETSEAYSFYTESYTYVDEEGFTVTVPESYDDLGTNIAKTEYDVAYITWGGKWQMPSRDDFYELFANTTKEIVQKNGVCGELRIGRNGNSIFLPYGGNYGKNESRDNIQAFNRIGYYWESTINYPKGKNANNEYIYDMSKNYGTIIGGCERYHHNSVRAVWK